MVSHPRGEALKFPPANSPKKNEIVYLIRKYFFFLVRCKIKYLTVSSIVVSFCFVMLLNPIIIIPRKQNNKQQKIRVLKYFLLITLKYQKGMP